MHFVNGLLQMGKFLKTGKEMFLLNNEDIKRL